MPNWCNNSVQISGPDQEIKNLWSQMTSGGDLQPMNCRPRPEDIGNDWLAWSRENWGTKWDMDVTDAYIDGGYVCLTGMTAWSPCLPLWEHISRLYPGVTITATYYEEGMDFVGAGRFKAGESVIEEGSLHDGFTYDGEHNWDDDHVEAWYNHVAEREEHYYSLVIDKEDN